MLKKIFKWSLIGSIVFLMFVIRIYIYSPLIVITEVSKTATTILGVLGKTQTFDNKYGVHAKKNFEPIKIK